MKICYIVLLSLSFMSNKKFKKEKEKVSSSISTAHIEFMVSANHNGHKAIMLGGLSSKYITPNSLCNFLSHACDLIGLTVFN